MCGDNETDQEGSLSDIPKEWWFNKFLSRGSRRSMHLNLPTFFFSMEKTDLYFTGLHTWKKFTPYA